MKLMNGMTLQGSYLIALDWSRTEVCVYDARTDSTETFKTIEDVAKRHPGCSLVLEATAESFELTRRLDVLAALDAAGIDAYVYPTRYTKNFRLKHKIEKNDAADAKVIYRVATETKLSLHKFGPLRGKNGDPVRTEISQFVITDRSVYQGSASLAYAEKYLGKIQKRKRKLSVAADVVPVVVPEEYKTWIYGTGGKYRAQIGRIFYTAEAVRRAGGGYREFRRQLGNYGNGYGRIMRSEINWWWTRPRLNAKMKELGIKPVKKSAMKNGKEVSIRTWPANEVAIRQKVMAEGVRVAKFLWHQTEFAPA